MEQQFERLGRQEKECWYVKQAEPPETKAILLFSAYVDCHSKVQTDIGSPEVKAFFFFLVFFFNREFISIEEHCSHSL